MYLIGHKHPNQWKGLSFGRYYAERIGLNFGVNKVSRVGEKERTAAKKQDQWFFKNANGTLAVTHFHPETLIAEPHRDSLAAWFSLYLEIEVGGPKDGEKPSNTFQAKKADLEKFLRYLTASAGSDHANGWTKAVSRGFLRWIKTERTKLGKPYAPTSTDRILATLRTASKWIHGRRPFLTGLPMEGIKNTAPRKRPAWRGLDQEGNNEVTRLKSAAEQLVKIQTRKNQQPRRNYALLVCGLNTGLRPSELLNLDLAQYDGRAFLNVACKGNQIVDRVPLSSEAREILDAFIELERGSKEGPLFPSKTGHRLTIQKFDRALKKIAAHANSRLPKDQHIHVSPHLLRHTALRKLCRTHGIEFAKKRSNHISDRHIWRYIEPGEREFLEAIEDV